MDPRHHRGNKKENHVHDAQGKTRLEHRARLVHPKPPPRRGHGAEIGKADLVREVGPRDGSAVGLGDEAQVVYSGDEGADKGQIDQADEFSVGRGAVVGEEREEGPGQRQDGDDEEEEDVGGRELVGFEVLVDEPGEHAHYGDLEGVLVGGFFLGLWLGSGTLMRG